MAINTIQYSDILVKKTTQIPKETIIRIETNTLEIRKEPINNFWPSILSFSCTNLFMTKGLSKPNVEIENKIVKNEIPRLYHPKFPVPICPAILEIIKTIIINLTA